MIALVCRSHPEPTQTFHRRSAEALERLGVPLVRIALRRAGAPGGDDGTVFLRDAGGRALPAFLRHPLRSLALLVAVAALARRADKEGGRLGAMAAWADGLRLADWARGRGDVERFHAQFASWEATAALVAARIAGVPFSFEAHNPFTLVVGRSLLRWKARRADVVPAISKDARRRLLALAPDLEGRVPIVRCGVDAADLRRLAASVEVPAYDVVAVGSLVPRKGHDVLVRALARLSSSMPHTRCAIVGDGPERARLESLVRETKAPVTLLGARGEAEALALTARARVAALACLAADDGDEDGIPVALIEAMALGVPVVSTSVGGIPELLEGGEAGLLVAERDPVGFEAALARVLSDDALRAHLVKAGAAAVAARHDLAHCAEALAGALGASVRQSSEA